MIALWGDYVGYPGGANLRTAGFTGVVRYVGVGSSGKRLTASEYSSLTRAGLQVLAVVESSTTEADNGYVAGQTDARAALADLAALGANAIPFVFATNDKSTYVQADVDYVRGFSSVLGAGRTGAYGFGDFLAAVHATGAASVYWQAGHPPNLTGTQGFVHFWQRQGTLGNGTDGPASPTTVTVGGVSVDYNNQLMELPNMTTLDDTFQSTYVGPDGVRSTTQLSYAQALANADGGQWTVRQMLDGELRMPMPDGARRNVFDAAVDTCNRLLVLESQVATLTGALAADEAALLAAIKAVAVPTVAVDAAAVAAALDAAGLPAQLVSAFVAVLKKV